MKPYYEHGGITIYHGDCLDVLPELFLVASAVVTDPPYGIAVVGKSGQIGGSRECEAKQYAPVHGDDVPFDPSHLLMFPKLVLFGANFYADRLPNSGGWLIWDKRDGGRPDNFSDAELAWSNAIGKIRLFSHLWRGRCKASERMVTRQHPTQKPVALFKWVYSTCDLKRDVVLDPYLGSGSSLLAAQEMNMRAIGIEIEERYCEIAAKRLQQEVLPLEQLA